MKVNASVNDDLKNNNLIQQHPSGRVLLENINENIQVLSLSHTYFDANVSLHGGQVLSWQPKGQPDIFWLSKGNKYTLDKGIRGGVPICWPWFGPAEGGPQHGFARTSLWRLMSCSIDDIGIDLVLEFRGENMSDLWPYKFVVQQVLHFGSNFKQRFIVKNTDQKAFTFTNALHSYFNVFSPEETAIPELNNAFYDNALTKVTCCKPSDIFDCVGPIDKIYHHENTLSLFDKGNKRVIEVKKQNSKQWVLWNPGAELAAGFVDLHPNGEDEFVCAEAANTAKNVISVEPNQTVEMSQEVNVHSL
jgi:glucose-6-phosphate 1-epimerase